MITTAQLERAAADIVDPAVYADGYPHDAWTTLRRESPVHRCELDGYAPFWAVTRHADIKRVTTNPSLFSSARGPVAIEPFRTYAGEPAVTAMPPSLITSDPPRHRQLRDLAAPYFMPRVMRELEQRVREITYELLDDFSGGDRELDFVADFASWHPLRMLCEILGVPRADEGHLLKITNAVFGGMDPEHNTGGSRWDGLMEYIPKLIADRRAAPREDLASTLSVAVLGGEQLPELELTMYLLTIASAGHDTTRSALSGGLLALWEHPDQLELLRERPELADLAAKEFVRWTTPVVHWVRTATADCELAGAQIRAGDRVATFFASGNRDETVFDDPFCFRLDRDPNPHLGFGHGEHSVWAPRSRGWKSVSCCRSSSRAWRRSS